MARKRNALVHLDYNSREYWNRLLAAEGLSVDAGRYPKQVYVGTGHDLEIVDTAEMQTRSGRVQPTNGKKPPPEPQRSLDEVIADLESDKKIAAALETQNQRVQTQQIIPVVDAPVEEKYFVELSLETKELQAPHETLPS
jgi:hypothetical protein